MADFGFPKSLRLLHSADFRRVQKRGRRLRARHLRVLVHHGAAGHSRFGLTVSRKVGNAVVRNRVKRHLREAIRHECGLLEEVPDAWDVVLIAHHSAATASGDELRRDVRRALDTLAGRRG